MILFRYYFNSARLHGGSITTKLVPPPDGTHTHTHTHTHTGIPYYKKYTRDAQNRAVYLSVIYKWKKKGCNIMWQILIASNILFHIFYYYRVWANFLMRTPCCTVSGAASMHAWPERVEEHCIAFHLCIYSRYM